MFLLFAEFHLHILATARQAFDAYILTAGFEYILNSDHINVDANSTISTRYLWDPKTVSY